MAKCKYIYSTGVYKILNKITGEFYIGSASRTKRRTLSQTGFYQRFWVHRNLLNKNMHYNKKLQNSWNKHGESNFDFIVLAACPPEYCIKLEQWFLDNLKPTYNFKLKAESNLGVKFTEEHRKNMSISQKKVDRSKNTKLRGISRPQWVRDNISKGRFGIQVSREGQIANRDKRRLHKNKTMKLTVDNVKEIKTILRDKKLPLIQIGELYGVSRSTINAIKYGVTFSDIKI